MTGFSQKKTNYVTKIHHIIIIKSVHAGRYGVHTVCYVVHWCGATLTPWLLKSVVAQQLLGWSRNLDHEVGEFTAELAEVVCFSDQNSVGMYQECLHIAIVIWKIMTGENYIVADEGTYLVLFIFSGRTTHPPGHNRKNHSFLFQTVVSNHWGCTPRGVRGVKRPEILWESQKYSLLGRPSSHNWVKPLTIEKCIKFP